MRTIAQQEGLSFGGSSIDSHYGGSSSIETPKFMKCGKTNV